MEKKRKSGYDILKAKVAKLEFENRRLSADYELEYKHRKMTEDRMSELWDAMGSLRQWLWKRKQKHACEP